jgi:hypothetical protein
MLVIRKDQLQALAASRRKDFERRLLSHLRKWFPGETAELGETGLLAWISHGQQCAAAYGFVSERDICKYLDLMLVFGQDFDTDPKHAWASAFLRGKSLHSPGVRMSRLIAAALRQSGGGSPEPANRSTA